MNRAKIILNSLVGKLVYMLPKEKLTKESEDITISYLMGIGIE
jgi:hypothetical protein